MTVRCRSKAQYCNNFRSPRQVLIIPYWILPSVPCSTTTLYLLTTPRALHARHVTLHYYHRTCNHHCSRVYPDHKHASPPQSPPPSRRHLSLSDGGEARVSTAFSLLTCGLGLSMIGGLSKLSLLLSAPRSRV
jgi:hypothetical protein